MMKPASPAPLRRSARINVRVPVTITGKLPGGKTFTEDTHIITISKYGAKLKSQYPLTTGMQLKVRPTQSRKAALFRVIWIGREGTTREGEVGIEYVEVSNLLGVTFPD
jgi:hypothetical protein